MMPARADLERPRLERWLVLAIALHSYAVGAVLLFAPRFGATLGGFEQVEPLFFCRQAGVFHILVATGYLLEHRRYGRVLLLLLAKSFAVVFLVGVWAIDTVPWVVPLSALGDGAMAIAVLWVRRRGEEERREAGERSVTVSAARPRSRTSPRSDRSRTLASS